MNRNHIAFRRAIRTMLALTVTGFLLAACSAMPIPVQIDLRNVMGNTDFAVRENVPEGEIADFDIVYPPEEESTLDFRTVDVPVNIERAQLRYDIEIAYDGAPLEGELGAQLYLAPNDGTPLFQDRYRVGPRHDVERGQTSGRFDGQVNLTREQLRALNDREVRWGIHARGSGESTRSGERTFYVTVHELILRAGIGLF